MPKTIRISKQKHKETSGSFISQTNKSLLDSSALKTIRICSFNVFWGILWDFMWVTSSVCLPGSRSSTLCWRTARSVRPWWTTTWGSPTGTANWDANASTSISWTGVAARPTTSSPQICRASRWVVSLLGLIDSFVHQQTAAITSVAVSFRSLRSVHPSSSGPRRPGTRIASHSQISSAAFTHNGPSLAPCNDRPEHSACGWAADGFYKKSWSWKQLYSWGGWYFWSFVARRRWFLRLSLL